jgi:hypothetical protein
LSDTVFLNTGHVFCSYLLSWHKYSRALNINPQDR